MVEAFSVTAKDEQGADWFGYDEVYASFYDAARSFAARTRTRHYDTGQTRSFDSQQRCIVPVAGSPFAVPPGVWACSEQGIAGPFEFEVALFESNKGPLFAFCPTDSVSESIVISGECAGDDRIGRRRLSFTAEELVAAMPHVGDTFNESITLGGPCGDFDGICGDGLASGPEYVFTYKVTRLPDQLLPLTPNQ
jgi:hypothetical protein